MALALVLFDSVTQRVPLARAAPRTRWPLAASWCSTTAPCAR
ncbi:MAG: hypothetical protein R3E96_07140 [Planctomycetota bacterium]